MDYKNEYKKNSFINELEKIKNIEEKYEFLIEIGQGLDKIKPSDKNQENLVPGCFSKVWCKVQIIDINDKILHFKINLESKSQIINGVLRIILEELDEKTGKEIILYNPDNLKTMGITTLLTPTRSNGILNVIKFIKEKVAKITVSYE